MKRIYLLHKDHILFGAEEVLAFSEKDHFLEENLLVASARYDLISRLGYAHSEHEFLFEAPYENFERVAAGFDWEKHYSGSFSVRINIHKRPWLTEKKLAGIIWNSLKEPKVSLQSPGSGFHFFPCEKKVICGRFLGGSDRTCLERKAHLKPCLHPTSLDPRLARACINISGVYSGTLLDPFCGAGGLITEAALMGYDVTGYDIDNFVLDKAKANLRCYDAKANIGKKDATTISEKANVIVTDLPYGKSSKISDEKERLYLDFLKAAYHCAPVMVAIFPDFIDHRKIIGKTEWRLEKEFSVYIHKSLTRNIVRLRRPEKSY